VLKSLAESRTIEADGIISCHLIGADANATEISLVENTARGPMHAADEFDARVTPYGKTFPTLKGLPGKDSCHCCAQKDKCPAGSTFVGNLEGTGSFNNNLNSRPNVVLRAAFVLNESYRQPTLESFGGGSDPRSTMQASEVPAGLFIAPYGTEDHDKGLGSSHARPRAGCVEGQHNQPVQILFDIILHDRKQWTRRHDGPLPCQGSRLRGPRGESWYP
jgi:hypothetical protein